MNVIPDRLLDVLELDLHLLAELEVERAQRLVQQQHAGAVDERARERDALPLAARELARLALRELAEAHERERLARALSPLRLGHALDAQPVFDVLLDAHVREQRVVLEHRVDVALVGRARVTSLRRGTRAPLVGRSKPAIIRRQVVLPEPDGPSSEKNSPRATSRLDVVDRHERAEGLRHAVQPHAYVSGRCARRSGPDRRGLLHGGATIAAGNGAARGRE